MNKVYSLIGAPRSGKGTVAKYLQETRKFEAYAFADKIKEECGIDKDRFEFVKKYGSAQEAEEIRDKLWSYSAEKKKIDPNYFINIVLDNILQVESNSVITDLRTLDEYNVVANKCREQNLLFKSFFVCDSFNGSFKNDILIGSDLTKDFICENIESGSIICIFNNQQGLKDFFTKLDREFFIEDILDITSDKQYVRCKISNYLNDYVIVKGRQW